MQIIFKFFNYSKFLQKQDLFKLYFYYFKFLIYLKLTFFFSMFFFFKSSIFYLFKLAFLYLKQQYNLFRYTKIFNFFVQYFTFDFSYLVNKDCCLTQWQGLPFRQDHFSLLRSSFIYKKAQEQFGKKRFLSFFCFSSFFFIKDYFYFLSFSKAYKKIVLTNFVKLNLLSL